MANKATGTEVHDSITVKELRAEKFGLAATPGATSSAYTVTNLTTDRALNCNENDDLATADVLGTLIGDLQAIGILG